MASSTRTFFRHLTLRLPPSPPGCTAVFRGCLARPKRMLSSGEEGDGLFGTMLRALREPGSQASCLHPSSLSIRENLENKGQQSLLGGRSERPCKEGKHPNGLLHRYVFNPCVSGDRCHENYLSRNLSPVVAAISSFVKQQYLPRLPVCGVLQSLRVILFSVAITAVVPRVGKIVRLTPI